MSLRKLLIAPLALGFGLAFMSACGEPERDGFTTPKSTASDETVKDPKTSTEPAPSTSPSPGAATSPTSGATCVAPAGVSTDLRTVEDVISLINALPMPVSMACVMDVLPRPLYLNATSSNLSVQPAVNRTTPRIFLFVGPSLIFSFVPGGPDSATLEMSSLVSSSTSVKAEIEFPVTSPLAADAGYTRIARSTGSGTKCTGCHSGETIAPPPYAAGAYVSQALRPLLTGQVSVFDVKDEARVCGNIQSERCNMFRSLFNHGDVQPKDFPSSMPTLF